jgi:hypothetical protein
MRGGVRVKRSSGGFAPIPRANVYAEEFLVIALLSPTAQSFGK